MIYQVGKLRLVPKLEDAEKTIKRLEDDLAQAVRATVLQHETICNLSDEIDRLRADLVELQSRYDQLTGEKFSDRCHTALRDRAKRAELEWNKLLRESKKDSQTGRKRRSRYQWDRAKQK